MIDRAAIFTELTRRNAVRREAKLPILDIPTEFSHAIEVATWQDACERHADDIARIKDDTLAKLRQERRDADFPQSTGGRWLFHFEVSKRFFAMMASHGYRPPASRNTVVYGSERSGVFGDGDDATG